jgi:ABC-type uncharacterized transport system permease subunit
MKPEGKFVPPTWIYLFFGIDFFAVGMSLFSKILFELQKEVTNFESGAWPFLIGLLLSILFAVGWQSSSLLEKFNRPIPEKWDFIVSIVFMPVLALFALLFAFLAFSRFFNIFSAGAQLLVSGMNFGLASQKRQKKS